MSDSESEAGDFSASEDEWLPETAQKGRSTKSTTSGGVQLRESSEDDEEDSEASDNDDVPRRISIKKTANSIRKPRAPLKPKSASAQKNKQADSDSSGDEHLVDADQLDLNSEFFSQAPVVQPSGNVPQFNCNAGVRLSDSSEEDESDKGESDKEDSAGDRNRKANKDLIAKINKSSQSFVNFEGLDQFNRNIEHAKKQLKSFEGKESKNDSALDIGDLLAMGEDNKKETSSQPMKSSKSKRKKDDSDSDWEDVEEKEEPRSQQDVQITLDVNPVAAQKKKRCNEFDIEACIKRVINREKRENQLVLHKVNIVMAIAHGNYVNTVLNDSKLLELALSMIPSQKCYPKDRTNLQYFEQITKFFKEIMDLKERRMFCRFKKLPTLQTSLRLQMLTKAAICKRDYILLFIILLRAIGVQCRMVMSLVVVPKKLPQAELHQTKSKTKLDAPKDETVSSSKVSKASSARKGGKVESSKVDHDYGEEKIKRKRCFKEKAASNALGKIPQLDGNDDSTGVPSKKPKTNASRNARNQTSNTGSKVSNSKLQEVNMFSPRKTRKQRQEQNKSSAIGEPSKPKTSKQNDNPSPVPGPSASPSSILIRKDYKDKSGKKTSIEVKTESTTKSKIAPKTLPSNSKANQDAKQSKAVTTKAIKSSPKLDKAKSSAAPKPSPKILKVEIFDKKLKQRLDRRVLSTDDEVRHAPDDNKTKIKSGINLWIEVYAEEEEQWVPIDAVAAKVHCLDHIVKQASSPLVYILAWNNDGTIKDVSARYCPNYATTTKKLRVEDDWLEETLAKFRGKRTARDIEEDRTLNRALMEQPLPKTISEYKNHPLYALKRLLLKFEGIYPPDAPTLGFIKDEPVYARECVQTLHSREIWLKQARTVKLFETAYKVVNARPKYDRASGQMLPAQPLELFGYWQTQDYEPPTAEDGIVPRNAYGNVELFKPCMLPKKTVHLQLPSLNRICKKLGIDCAQAVTGFDFHGGSSHPVYDGFVVCEEYKDIVVDAWYQEQEQEEKREREKYEKRVYGNWKKLIKGLLIRRRLQNKYNFDNLSG